MKAILKQVLKATATGVANIVVMALVIPVAVIAVVGGLGASLQHPIQEESKNENDNNQP